MLNASTPATACHFGYYPFIDLPSMPKGGNICGVTQEYSTAKGTYEKKLQWKHTPYGDAYTEPQRFEYTMGSADPKLMQDLMTIVKLLDMYGVSLYELLGMRTPNNLLNYLCLSPKVSPWFRQWLEREVGAPYGTMDFGRKYAELVVIASV